ncbi:MAG: DsrE family protein [Tardiphaga sp.]
MNRSTVSVAQLVAVGLFMLLDTRPDAAAELEVRNRLNANAKANTIEQRTQTHRLAVQVAVNDPATMNLVLNNVSNAVQHYNEIGQKIEVEVVAFGPGLHMMREDTSPVKSRIKTMSETMPGVTFSACGNTRENMTKVESKEIPLISQANVTKSGVVRLIELQERGWTYLRP